MTYDEVRGTAPPEPTPEQLARAMEQRVLPVIPERLSDPELRLIRRPPASPLVDSYRTQRYTLEAGNGRYLLTPEPAGTESSPGRPTAQPPIELPVHFISSWHRGGASRTFAECLAGPA